MTIFCAVPPIISHHFPYVSTILRGAGGHIPKSDGILEDPMETPMRHRNTLRVTSRFLEGT